MTKPSMSKQPGLDPAPKSHDDDASPGEFIDKPENLPGDHDQPSGDPKTLEQK